LYRLMIPLVWWRISKLLKFQNKINCIKYRLQYILILNPIRLVGFSLDLAHSTNGINGQITFPNIKLDTHPL
jgi:hypothetical protein